MLPFIVKCKNCQRLFELWKLFSVLFSHYKNRTSQFFHGSVDLTLCIFWGYECVLFNPPLLRQNLHHRTVRDDKIMMRPTRIWEHLWGCGWGDAAHSGTDRGNSPDPEGWPDNRQRDKSSNMNQTQIITWTPMRGNWTENCTPQQQ